MTDTQTKLRALADELDAALAGKASRSYAEISYDIINEVSARRTRITDTEPNRMNRGVAAYNNQRRPVV